MRLRRTTSASDDNWINYYNNLTIPPGRSDGAAIVRRYKQKFYQKFVDSSFEVQTLGESAQAASRSSQASSSSSKRDKSYTSRTTTFCVRLSFRSRSRTSGLQASGAAHRPPGILRR